MDPTKAEPHGRVAVLAPQGRDGPVMAEALARAGLEAFVATPEDADDLQALGLLLVTTEALTPSTVGRINRAVGAQESWSDVPVVLLLGKGSQDAPGVFDERCNLSILERPLRVATLVATVRAALRARGRQYEVRDLLRQRSLLNDELRRHASVLEATNRELEAFSYSVSHDLRAPLRSIAGFSQVLLEDHLDHLDEAGQHYLQRIRANARRMGELIDALLTLSRVSQRGLERRPVDVCDLARQVAARLREQHGTEVECLVEECPPVLGDPGLLGIVVENLLGNAWKFSARRGEPRVRFGGRSEPPEVVFWVEDNGVGFDMAQAERLFTAFQRLHSEAEFSGSGIGLATVQRIVHRHEGRVWAESEPGKGATFFVALPAAPAGGEDCAASPG